MIVQTFGNDIPIVIFKKIISQDYIDAILNEIRFYNSKGFFLPPEDTASAVNQITGQVKKNKTFFLLNNLSEEQIYQSSIVNLHKNHINKIFFNELHNKHSVFKYFDIINQNDFIINAYSDGDNYFPHADSSTFTSLLFFWDTPKKFTGGELTFNDYGITYDPEIGDVVIFPGFCTHGVLQVHQQVPDLDSGRFSIAQTLYIDPVRR